MTREPRSVSLAAMTTLEDIEKAVTQLPADQLAKFRAWFEEFEAARLVSAIDSRGGRVAIHGWKTITAITPTEMMQTLEPYCSAFLYTHIDTEGMLKGIPMEVVRELCGQTRRRLAVAGGIRSQQEINELDAMGVDAVVGMAIYSGIIKV